MTVQIFHGDDEGLKVELDLLLKIENETTTDLQIRTILYEIDQGESYITPFVMTRHEISRDALYAHRETESL